MIPPPIDLDWLERTHAEQRFILRTEDGQFAYARAENVADLDTNPGLADAWAFVTALIAMARAGETERRATDVVLQLLNEGVLSEGQVSSRLGIDRLEVRRLADALRVQQ